MSGFSLLEVLVAITILVVTLTTLAQLSTTAARTNITARRATVAALLAAQKMEQLRALTWGFDAAGNRSSDTTTDITIFPPRPNQGVGLSPSPPGALRQNTSGYCDYLDANGRWVGAGAFAPPTAVFARRWSVEPLPASPDSLVLQVIVARHRAGTTERLLPDEARLVTVKTRTAS
jgi:prepilin-type N-terminal cleavage/methylation domain-containing protein